MKYQECIKRVSEVLGVREAPHWVRAVFRRFGLGRWDELHAEGQKMLEEWVARGLAGEPLARVEGEKAFFKSGFLLNAWTLEPRPETEDLVEWCLKNVCPSPRNVLDLGTGTGCILLSLLKEWPEAQGVGVDKEPRVFEAAQKNALALELENRVSWLEGDFSTVNFEAGAYDLVVSNPPYIPHDDIAHLSTAVRDHDPLLALDGGADGLDPYRIIIPKALSWLRPGGFLVFEVGHDQADVVHRWMRSLFRTSGTVLDLFGVERFAWGRRD